MAMWRSWRAVAASVVVALLVLGFVVSAYADEAGRRDRIANVLDMLRRGIERVEELAEEQGVLEEISGEIDEVRALVEEARSLLEQGELEQAWEKAREAMHRLRQIIISLPNPPQAAYRRMLAEIHRLENIQHRLENIALNALDEEIRRKAAEAANTLHELIQQARELLEQGELEQALEKIQNAKDVVRDFAKWLAQNGRDRIESKLRETLDAMRERLENLRERLENLDGESQRARIALKVVERLLELVERAEDALERGELHEALRITLRIRHALKILEDRL